VSPVGTPAPPAVAVLRAEHVTKMFGGLVAVNDVSFDVPQNSIVSLIGPNGAGKTTLFNMITGLYRPTEGRILLGERDITHARPDLITKHGVARTFQNIRLFGAMTAVENVMVGHHARMRAGLFKTHFVDELEIGAFELHRNLAATLHQLVARTGREPGQFEVAPWMEVHIARHG